MGRCGGGERWGWGGVCGGGGRGRQVPAHSHQGQRQRGAGHTDTAGREGWGGGYVWRRGRCSDDVCV